jgi:hypothetical protein
MASILDRETLSTLEIQNTYIFILQNIHTGVRQTVSEHEMRRGFPRGVLSSMKSEPCLASKYINP